MVGVPFYMGIPLTMVGSNPQQGLCEVSMTTKTQDSMAVGTNETVDTIVAISTPPGRGGIGVVRLAGPAAIEVAEQLVRVKHSLRAPEAHARA